MPGTMRKKLLLVVALACFICFVRSVYYQFISITQTQKKPNMFITRSEFEAECSDAKLVKAVKQSSQFFPTFQDFYGRGLKNCTNFVVVVGERHDKSIVPVGIQVTSILEDSIIGRRFENELNQVLGTSVTVKKEQMLDCRFTRSFLLEGGFLYRELWNKAESTAKARIAEEAEFFMEIPKDCKAEDFALIRQFEELQSNESVLELCKSRANDPLKNRKLPNYKSNFKLEDLSILEYLVKLGHEEKAIAILQSREIENETAEFLILNAIKFSRNKVLAELIEMFGDVSKLNLGTGNCLHKAIDSDNLEAARMFLELGFDVNERNRFKETPFASAKSLAMAKLLLSKNADTRAPVRDGELNSAEYLYLRCHARNKELADFIRPFCTDSFLGEFENEAPLDEGNFLAQLEEPRSLAGNKTLEFIISALNTDYGSVLPARMIPLAK